MMNKKAGGPDVVMDVLKTALQAFPNAPFIQSLHQQYQERGFLTKKQLQGLHSKSSKIKDIAPGKLATLEAMIAKLPDRFKSEKPVSAPIYEKNIPVQIVLLQLLEKYPQHKQVLLFKHKFDNNIPLSALEIADLEKFYKLLILKK